MRSRLIVSLSAILLIVAACSSSGSSSAAKTATSAADLGGVDKLCAAGKTEGQLTLIATPSDWANYGQMITRLHGQVRDQGPIRPARRRQPAEIKAATDLAGTGRQPDLFDLTSAVASANTDKFAPYKVATWADIPDANKEPTGLWINNYTGFQIIAYDASLGDITKVADLADPKYKGKVALNGDPLKAGAALQRRRPGRTGQRRIGRQHRARRRLLQEADRLPAT